MRADIIKSAPAGKSHRDHVLSVYVSYEFKERLRVVAEKHDRTIADIIRVVLKLGLPLMEALSDAEEVMVREHIEMFRKLRQVKSLKEI